MKIKQVLLTIKEIKSENFNKITYLVEFFSNGMLIG